MNQKLLITSRLLLVKFPKFLSGIFHPVVPKSTFGKVSLLMFFVLFAINANAQLTTEDFESGIPTAWGQANNTVGTSTFGISTDGYNSSTGAAFIDPTAENIGAGNTAQYYLVTPLVTVPANGEIRFFTKQGDAAEHGNIYQVKLSTAGQTDISGFTTTLATWTESQISTNYEEKVVSIPGSIAPGLSVYIAFVLVNDQPGATPDADTWYLDNIGIQSAEVCDPVLAADFTVTSVTTETAELTWTHPTATNFEIQIVADGATPGTVGTPTDNTYSAGSLTAETDYDVYIKTICTTTESTWAGPFDLTTAILGTSCEAPIVIPDDGNTFTLSSNLNAFVNPDLVYTTPGTDCVPAGVSQNYLNGDKAFLTFTPSQDGLLTLSQTTLPFASGTGCFGNANSGVFVYESCANVGVQCIDGTITTATATPAYVSNLFVQAGQTYVIVISSPYGTGTSVCFDFTADFSTCAPPASFTYSHLLQNTVSFSWDNEANLVSNWEYAAVPTGSPAPTSGLNSTSTNIDNALTGLTAGTTYDLYVRSVCGGTPGEWSNPYKFTTQCDVFDTPYTTNFAGTSATAPQVCWTSVDVNADGLKWTYLGGYATLQTNTYPDFNNDMLVTPQINFTGAQKRLRFKDRTTNGVSSYSIKVSTTGIGGDEFTTVIMPETQITNTSFEERIIYIPTTVTGAVNIAFVVTPGTGSIATRISIDDVFIEDVPACPDPLNIAAADITTDSATLSWSQGFQETQWEVIVQPTGIAAPADTDSGDLTTNNINYPVSDLDHSTQYDVYVRAYCNDTDQSNWVGPYMFITECGIFDVPYFENFNTGDTENSHKFCWSILDANEDGAQWNFTTTLAAIQGNPFFGTPVFDDWLISPAINVVGTKELKFKYRAAFSFFFPNPRFGVQVLMSTTDTDPASFTEIMPLMEFTNTDYIEKSLYINANGPVYIAFRVPPTFSTAEGTSVFQLEDVRIDEAPACPMPNYGELTASNITQTDAVLAWTPGFQEAEWQVIVQQQGTGVPTDTDTGDQTTNNTAYPAENLLPNTTYEYYVRAYCNDTDQSEWVGPYTFTTLCEAFTTPFLETFEPSSESEECWRSVNENSDNYAWTFDATLDAFEGIHSAGIFSGSNGNNDDYLISPTITVTAGQRLRFQYRTYTEYFEEDLEIRLSVNGNELSEFTTVLYNSDDDPNPINNPYWKEMILNLPAGITGDINIAWVIPQREPSPLGYRGQTLLIDNVVIEDVPTCAAPNNLAVNSITDASVQLSWNTNGDETAWDIYVQPAGMGAPVGDGDPEYLSTVDSNPTTVNGLTAASQYEYYVRAACSDTEKSEWVGPYVFTTLCPLATACEYTFTLTNDSGGFSGELQIIQNELVVTTIDLPGSGAGAITVPVFLCDGVEFSVYWDGLGSYVPGSSSSAVITIAQGGSTIWTSPSPLDQMNTVLYNGFASCSTVTCPQPTALTVDANGILSWTAGGSETQWEVYLQPLDNGTLPQSGIIVDTNSYTPSAADFNMPEEGTYEFFVRAVCGEGDESFWSGPQEFVRNDSADTALVVPVNGTETCEESVSKISFINATVSPEPMTCAGANDGDVWLQFDAVAKVHAISLTNFSGSYYYSGGNPPHANVTMTLYHVNGTVLEELACSENNVIVAAYSSELIVGDTYKVRLTLNGTAPNEHTFDVCITTPQDLCALDAVNGGFETPPSVFGINNFYDQHVVPGWRNNLTEEDTSLYNTIFFSDQFGVIGYTPYEGGQSIQLVSADSSEPTNPDDLVNIKGTYQDFDSSEVVTYNYSFAHLSRSDGTVVQLYAGPPAGPFELLVEQAGTVTWAVYEGEYNVPAGQDVTRFIFRSKDNAIGNIIDAVSITANNEIVTEPQTLDCTEDTLTLEAKGVGEWSADENNPTEVVFEDAANSTTTVSGLIASGDYTFYWNTRYCENSLVITNIAVDDVPEVTSPVEYCQGATAEALTAAEIEGYTLAWYTVPTEGTAETEATVPSTETVGTTSYYVAYVNAEGCEGQRAQIDVVINEPVAAVVEFSYESPSCINSGDELIPNIGADFTFGGTFTSATLTVDPETGIVDLTTATEGTHEIVYTFENDVVTCTAAGTYTATVELVGAITPVVEFSYNSVYCYDSGNVLPETETGFTTGGVFTAEVGLVIDPVTGEIDTMASTAGTYTVTYTIEADEATCNVGGTHTATLTVVGDLSVGIDQECRGSSTWLVATAANGTFGNDVTYVWRNEDGIAVGSDSAEFNVSEYFASNSTLELPLGFTLTVTAGSCTGEAAYTVETMMCQIPRGISPNGDGDNDTFDLTDLGVSEIVIFNRYGKQVFEQSNGYTNQWHGQDKKGNDLPDGTYFYSLTKSNGEQLTGWVYISREY